MLKSKFGGSLQEVVLPDFPDDDNTVTTTVTKSRRVSFGTNFVKEFIVGSAVSAQCMSEYEQAFPSSDSSNADSSHSVVESGILDHSTINLHENHKVHKTVPSVSQVPEPDLVENRPKVPKFSSTICFSADSPTADMEFTEGCITLAKSILDKKNKEMTVIIQAKPKDSKDEERHKEEDTKYFDASQVEMSITRCLKTKENLREEKKFEGEKTRIFNKYEDEMSITKCNHVFNNDESDNSWEDCKENRMPLDLIMRHLDKDNSDLENDLFNPEKSFSILLNVGPFDCSNESEKLNLNESMDISIDFSPKIKNSEKFKTVDLQPDEPLEKFSTINLQPKSPFERLNSVDLQPNDPLEKLNTVDLQRNEPLKERNTVELHSNEPLEKSNTVKLQPSETLEKSCSFELHPNEPFRETNTVDLQGNEPLKEKNTVELQPNDPLEKSCAFELQPNEPLKERDTFELQPSETLEKFNAFELHPNEPLREANTIDLHERNDPLEKFSTVELQPNYSLEKSSALELHPNEPFRETNTVELQPNDPLEKSCALELQPNERLRETITVDLHERNDPFEKFSTVELQPNYSLEQSSALELRPNELPKQTNAIALQPEDLLQERNAVALQPNDSLEKSNALDLQPSEPLEKFNTVDLHERNDPLEKFNTVELQPNESPKEINTVNLQPNKLLEFSSPKGQNTIDQSMELDAFRPSDSNRLLQLDRESHSEMLRQSDVKISEVDLEPEPSENSSPDEVMDIDADIQVGVSKILENPLQDKSSSHLPLRPNDFQNSNQPKEAVEVNSDNRETFSKLEESLPPAETELNNSKKSYLNKCMEITPDVQESGVKLYQEPSPNYKINKAIESNILEEPDEVQARVVEPSLIDRKVIESLKEQSKEPECTWSLKDVQYQAKSLGCLLSFKCKLLESLTTIHYHLKLSKEDTLDSCSTVTKSEISLDEEEQCRLPEYQLVIDFGFEKLKQYFDQRRVKVETIRHIPYFLDQINLFLYRVNCHLRQIHSILTLYPGSRLTGSLLSFRLYSFPIFFSSVVSIDLTNLFRLSESSLSFENDFGSFDENKIRQIFQECLKCENSLCEFVVQSTKYLIDVEKESGYVSKRRHIRLLPVELTL